MKTKIQNWWGKRTIFEKVCIVVCAMFVGLVIVAIFKVWGLIVYAIFIGLTLMFVRNIKDKNKKINNWLGKTSLLKKVIIVVCGVFVGLAMILYLMIIILLITGGAEEEQPDPETAQQAPITAPVEQEPTPEQTTLTPYEECKKYVSILQKQITSSNGINISDISDKEWKHRITCEEVFEEGDKDAVDSMYQSERQEVIQEYEAYRKEQYPDYEPTTKYEKTEINKINEYIFTYKIDEHGGLQQLITEGGGYYRQLLKVKECQGMTLKRIENAGSAYKKINEYFVFIDTIGRPYFLGEASKATTQHKIDTEITPIQRSTGNTIDNLPQCERAIMKSLWNNAIESRNKLIRRLGLTI